MASSSQHRCVFVGNIPYDVSEEQLIDICREVGPVVSFRLVIDRETGRPKGYGFCEYKDEETALSARRNLQGYEINGRQLRVDFAENDKNVDKNREQGHGGPGVVTTANNGGAAVLGESAQHQPIGLHIAITAATVMAGALGGAQSGMQSNQNGLQSQSALASDPLTLHLAKMSRSQLYDIISEMKAMATQNKEVARQLLLARPQLPKALFQAQIMLGLVNAQLLHMPNIRQSSGQAALNTLQDTQQAQQPAIETFPGLRPLAESKHPGLVSKMHEGQFSSVTQSSLVENQTSIASQPMQPRSQIPQLSVSRVPQQVIPPGQSGVLPLRPVHHSVRPQVQRPNTSSLNQQPPISLLQHSGQQVGTVNLRHTSQVVLQNAAMQSCVLGHPTQSDATFQLGPTISGISDAVGSDSGRSIQAPFGTVQVHRSNAYLKMQANVVDGLKEPANRPSKLLKLDDGRNMHFASGGLNASNATGAQPSQAFSVSPKNLLSRREESQCSEKQVSQPPSDEESALLQQVLNLTAEQLNSLPPEQRQQVIQLQKALRRDQIQPS